MNKSAWKAFTLVELIVVITILAILWTIGFISLSGYAVIARDTSRISDINILTKAIELHKLEEWGFPSVSNWTDVVFSGSTIWTQWTFWEASRKDARRVSNIPTDPLTGSEYAYATTQSTWEYQVWVMVENEWSFSFIPWVQDTYADGVLAWFASTKIKWNYNGKFITHTQNLSSTSKNVWILWAPSLLLTDISSAVANKIDLSTIHGNNLFVYEWEKTAPASYSWSLVTYTTSALWVVQTTQNNPDSLVEVIYEGTTNELSTGTGKLDLAENIVSYYTGTPIAESYNFDEWANIDPSTDTNQAVALINTYVDVGVGWLDSERLGIVLTPVSSDDNPVELVSSASCYDPLNVNEIWAVSGSLCDGMLIVDRALLNSAATIWLDRWIDKDGTFYTFWDTAHNVFTGQITDLSFMFNGNTLFNSDIDYWDTSKVTTMAFMFNGVGAFNQALSFDTSKVENMSYMFHGNSTFNQPLTFDTSKVEDMSRMFLWASTFNQALLFDTSSVTDMSFMFISAWAFNQGISWWDVSNVVACTVFSAWANAAWMTPDKPLFTSCAPWY
jgi:prepilin-type N-terminal cleavage/methylation domain-containing protein